MSVPYNSETNLVIKALVNVYKNDSNGPSIFIFVVALSISTMFIRLIW